MNNKEVNLYRLEEDEEIFLEQKKRQKEAIEILKREGTSHEKFETLYDMGLDLEDIFDAILECEK